MNKENQDAYIRLTCTIKRILMNWKQIIICMLIFAYGFDVFKTMTYHPIYQSSITAYFNNGGVSNWANIEGAVKYMEAMNYIFNSDMVKEKIHKNVDIDTTTTCYVSSINNTNMAKISVQADSKRGAYYGLQTILDWYDENKNELKFSYDIDVIDSAGITTDAINPNNHTKNLMIGGLGSGIVYVGFLFMIVYFSNTVKTPRDIEKSTSVRVYAKLPRESKRIGLFKTKKSILISTMKTSFNYRESVKKLRTRFEESAQKHGYKTVIVTGSLENEGKSSVAANLALSLADNNHKVLLVDCDLRKPSVHKLFEKGNQDVNLHNVNNAIKGQTIETQIMMAGKEDDETKLDILVAKDEKAKDVEKIVNSNQFKVFLQQLNELDYDYVIIDTPPARYLPDTKIINEYVDGCLLVVKQDTANVKEISETITLLTNVKENLIGCIYNASVKDFKAATKMYGSRYSRYSKGGSK